MQKIQKCSAYSKVWVKAATAPAIREPTLCPKCYANALFYSTRDVDNAAAVAAEKFACQTKYTTENSMTRLQQRQL